MGVVSQLADRVLVMYAGRCVEQGPRAEVFRNPQHPYTWGLLGSVPRARAPRVRRLPAIPGSPSSALDVPPGCPFAPRCLHRHEQCSQRPSLEGNPMHTGGPGHVDACWLPRGDRKALRRQAVEKAIAAGDPGQVEVVPDPAATFVSEDGPAVPVAQP